MGKVYRAKPVKSFTYKVGLLEYFLSRPFWNIILPIVIVSLLYYFNIYKSTTEAITYSSIYLLIKVTEYHLVKPMRTVFAI